MHYPSPFLALVAPRGFEPLISWLENQASWATRRRGHDVVEMTPDARIGGQVMHFGVYLEEMHNLSPYYNPLYALALLHKRVINHLHFLRQ